jgi:hypothetical protein
LEIGASSGLIRGMDHENGYIAILGARKRTKNTARDWCSHESLPIQIFTKNNYCILIHTENSHGIYTNTDISLAALRKSGYAIICSANSLGCYVNMAELYFQLTPIFSEYFRNTTRLSNRVLHEFLAVKLSSFLCLLFLAMKPLSFFMLRYHFCYWKIRA